MAGLPTTPEAVSKRIASINDALTRVSTAAEEYADMSTKGAAAAAQDTTTAAAAAASSAQAQLVSLVKNLLAEVQGPIGAILDLFSSLPKIAALRCLAELGVFAAAAGTSGEPATVDEILGRLGDDVDVEKALLVRLLRTAAAAAGVVEVGEGTYALTASSAARVLAHPDMAAMFKHLVDESGPALVLMPRFFVENGWRQPADPRNCPYTFAHRTEGTEMWEHVAKFPERQKNSNRAMKAQSFDGVWSVGLFPFAEKIKELGYKTDASTPLVVDVGGGAGHTSAKIRELCKEIEGTIVLQDLSGVVEDVSPAEGIVTMAHDFFEEQPVKGAPIYFLRRILHDWADPSSVAILKRIADAMDRKLPSRLVIAEQILPTRGVSSESVLVDMLMMTFTGMERTEKQWEELLGQAGLKVVGFHRAPGTPFGAVEAVLA
ncbi:O-methyltransferase [Diaporthe helianthi]|uniref:O-methyltransferase n=1 Tax=Diaporthe helianthi TaxID=158607 RepID=A0A2P5IGD6_DIAHE|nr:O-methyltransferase [Diaporthe helianthi]